MVIINLGSFLLFQISSAYGHTQSSYDITIEPSQSPAVGVKLESSTPLLMSTLRIKIDVTGVTDVKINGLGQHGQYLCGVQDFIPVRQIGYSTFRYRALFNQAGTETGIQLELSNQCKAVGVIVDSKIKLTLPVDPSLSNVFYIRSPQSNSMPLDPLVSTQCLVHIFSSQFVQIISEQYQYTKSNFLSRGGTKLISVTPLSTPEVILTIDLKEAPTDVRVNSVKQEGAADNICGINTFPVSKTHIYMQY